MNKNQYRFNVSLAESELTSLIPDEEKRKVILGDMAQSIYIAHDCHFDRWALNLDASEHFLRLNVGPIFIKTIERQNIGLTLVRTDNVMPSDVQNPYPIFATCPNLSYYYMPHDRYLDLRHQIAPLHIEAIIKAAESACRGRIQSAHSPAAVDCLSAMARRRLPQPNYYTMKIENESNAILESYSPFPEDKTYREGNETLVTLRRLCRNPETRKKCLKHHGRHCFVCGFDFDIAYGTKGLGLVQAHHLKPIKDGERQTHPVRDMRPVCCNCHAVLTRHNLSIEELKSIYEASPLKWIVEDGAVQ